MKKKKRIKTLQMLMWTIAILIQMSVVNALEIRAETTAGRELTLRYEINKNSEMCEQPEEFHVDETGLQYQLEVWSIDSVTMPALKKQVGQHMLYEQIEGTSEIPETIEIQAQDRTRGQKITVICQMQKKELIEEAWVDGFMFPVTFHAYGSEYYHLADRLIPYNEEQPELEGCEELLLENIGVSPETYRITYVQWSEAPYEDAEGIPCRDAMAFGLKLVRDYRVTYAGVAEFPEGNGWQTVAVYRQTTETETMPTNHSTESVQQKEVVLEPTKTTVVPTELPVSTLWERITKTLMMTIAIGVVLFLGGLLLLALLRVAKKAKACYNRKKTK